MGSEWPFPIATLCVVIWLGVVEVIEIRSEMGGCFYVDGGVSEGCLR